MDKWKLLKTQEDFDNLRENQILYFRIREKCSFNENDVCRYFIGADWFINSINEIIFNKKKNYYFSIENYINGVSRVVDEVWLTDL